MKTRLPGILSILSLISTILFLVFLIMDTASAGPLDSFERVLEHARQQTTLSTLAYVNVTFLTVLATMWMAALYEICKPKYPMWGRIAMVFVPVYSVLNLFVYLSQVTIVPRLLEMADEPGYRQMAEFLLRQTLQSWPESAVSIINNTAYAVLGIPSIIFGAILMKMDARFRPGGFLLAANGLACLIGIVGIAGRYPLLASGSLVGAVFFLLALAVLGWQFLRIDSAG